MKRMVVLGVLLMLAMGSLGLAHNLPSNMLQNNLDTVTVFDVEVNVAPFIHIVELDASPMVWNLTAPSGTIGEAYNWQRPFVFKSNALIRVRISETISAAFPSSVGAGVVVAPNLRNFNTSTDTALTLESATNGIPGAQTGEYVFATQRTGTFSGITDFGIGWYAPLGEAWDLMATTADNPYTGHITLTFELAD